LALGFSHALHHKFIDNNFGLIFFLFFLLLVFVGNFLQLEICNLFDAFDAAHAHPDILAAFLCLLDAFPYGFDFIISFLNKSGHTSNDCH
jgi:hypothetical protein